MTGYPGANLIAWTCVKDAKSYTIYRLTVTIDGITTFHSFPDRA